MVHLSEFSILRQTRTFLNCEQKVSSKKKQKNIREHWSRLSEAIGSAHQMHRPINNYCGWR